MSFTQTIILKKFLLENQKPVAYLFYLTTNFCYKKLNSNTNLTSKLKTKQDKNTLQIFENWIKYSKYIALHFYNFKFLKKSTFIT